MLAEELEYLSATEGKRLSALAECVGRALSGLINSCVAFAGTMLRNPVKIRGFANDQRPTTNDDF